jgi:hypothetical protein
MQERLEPRNPYSAAASHSRLKPILQAISAPDFLRALNSFFRLCGTDQSFSETKIMVKIKLFFNIP